LSARRQNSMVGWIDHHEWKPIIRPKRQSAEQISRYCDISKSQNIDDSRKLSDNFLRK
jgi:oligoribonuclease NrnB/cAMP/cGMP phosphodiesterase (DHH superfamily)